MCVCDRQGECSVLHIFIPNRPQGPLVVSHSFGSPGSFRLEFWCLNSHKSHLLWERVEAVGLLGVGEGHSHAGGEWRVEDDGGTLVARCQIHRRHGPDALAVHDHILRPDAVAAKRQNN